MRVAIAVVVLASMTNAAHALNGCAGSYSATALLPLPQPAIVHYELFDNSPRNIRLAQALRAGLTQGGLSVTGTPTLTLSLSYHLMNQGGGGGYDQWGAQTDWNGMGGGVGLEQPDMPQFRATSPGPATLFLRADLRDAQTQATVWVASFQCQLQTSPDANLAFGIGQLIGQSAGKRIDNASM